MITRSMFLETMPCISVWTARSTVFLLWFKSKAVESVLSIFFKFMYSKLSNSILKPASIRLVYFYRSYLDLSYFSASYSFWSLSTLVPLRLRPDPWACISRTDFNLSSNISFSSIYFWRICYKFSARLQVLCTSRPASICFLFRLSIIFC